MVRFSRKNGWCRPRFSRFFPDVSCVVSYSTAILTLAVVLGSQSVVAEPTVSGSTISWDDDGWYQVQRLDDQQEVCGGGTACDVDPGEYIVINHDTGERWESIVVGGAAATGPRVEGSRILLPSDGWYQVQSAVDFSTVCEGVQECNVSDGVYIIINHDTAERWENVVVGTLTGPMDVGAPQLDGNTFSWDDDGWYQVQDASTLATVCEGGSSCVVEPGIYTIINHTTGQRFEEQSVTSGAPVSEVTVVGNRISWPNDGWYQVLDAMTYAEVCAGGSFCDVADGGYVVINHDTGARYEDIRVGMATPPPVEPPAPEEPPVEPPVDPVDLASAIQGAWHSQCEAIAGGARSARQIAVFTDAQLVRDWHEFDGPDCAGVPRGQYYPLETYSYTLGSDMMTDEGVSGAQLNVVSTQLSNMAYSPAFGPVTALGEELAQTRYLIVAVVDGALWLPAREPTAEENRPTLFTNGDRYVPRLSLTSATTVPADLAGLAFRTNCRALGAGASIRTTVTFSSAEFYINLEERYLNEGCFGFPDAATTYRTNLQFGEPAFSLLGDRLLPVITDREMETIVFGEALLSDITLKEPRTRWDAFALVDGNTLMFGDCINRVDNCKREASVPADMIDYEFNSTLRYRLVDPADPGVVEGSSDVSAIAGLWDLSSTNDAGATDVIYMEITPDGNVTYWDFLGDEVDGGEACYTTRSERISALGDDRYLFVDASQDPPSSYVATSLVRDGVLIGNPGTDFESSNSAVPEGTTLNEC